MKKLYKKLFIATLAFLSINLFCYNAEAFTIYEMLHHNQIKKVRSLFTDEYSVAVFDNLVKFDAHNQKVPFNTLNKNIKEVFREHECPNVVVEEGDTIIDGGVSENLYFTEMFLEMIGENGTLLRA